MQETNEVNEIGEPKDILEGITVERVEHCTKKLKT
jgi:hypothetical protein